MEGCSFQRFMLLSIKVTTYYARALLNNVVFVIRVDVKSINKNQYLSYIKSSSRYKNQVNYNDTKRRIVKFIRSETIALVEYNCCGNVNPENNTDLFYNGDDRDYNRSSANTFNDKRVFEDIT